jgi:hypothetical protein
MLSWHTTHPSHTQGVTTMTKRPTHTDQLCGCYVDGPHSCGPGLCRDCTAAPAADVMRPFGEATDAARTYLDEVARIEADLLADPEERDQAHVRMSSALGALMAKVDETMADLALTDDGRSITDEEYDALAG